MIHYIVKGPPSNYPWKKCENKKHVKLNRITQEIKTFIFKVLYYFFIYPKHKCSIFDNFNIKDITFSTAILKPNIETNQRL